MKKLVVLSLLMASVSSVTAPSRSVALPMPEGNQCQQFAEYYANNLATQGTQEWENAYNDGLFACYNPGGDVSTYPEISSGDPWTFAWNFCSAADAPCRFPDYPSRLPSE